MQTANQSRQERRAINAKYFAGPPLMVTRDGLVTLRNRDGSLSCGKRKADA